MRSSGARALDIAVDSSLAGVVVSVVLLGYITATQPHFYALIGVSLLVYLMARGEELLGALTQYLTSKTAAWRWAFVAWALLSLLWTTRTGFSADRAMTVVEIQVVGLVFFDAARNLGKARWILGWVLACTVISSVVAVLTGDPTRVDRLAGLHRNPNTLGIISVVGLAVYCASISEIKRGVRFLLSYSIGFALLVGILASASLKGIVGLISVLGLSMLFGRLRLRVAALMGTVAAAATIAVNTVEPLRLVWVHTLNRVEITLSALTSSAETSLSLLERVRFIRKGLALFAETPIMGRGLGTFRWLSDEHTYAHNNIVEVGVSLGIIGLVLYYGFYATVLAESFRTRNRRDFVGRFTILMVITVLVLDVASVSYTAKLSTLLMIMSAGWLERAHDPAPAASS